VRRGRRERWRAARRARRRPAGTGSDRAACGGWCRSWPAELQAEKISTGGIDLDIDGETVTVDGDAVDVIEEYRAESGEEVAVIEADGATVIVYP
jgi:hypothetical protein